MKQSNKLRRDKNVPNRKERRKGLKPKSGWVMVDTIHGPLKIWRN